MAGNCSVLRRCDGSKRFVLFALILYLFTPSSVQAKSELKVAYFTQDPPAIVSLADSFDPDSYSVITQIFDSLVHFDLNGNIQPALATHWQSLSSTRWRFDLRKDVKFHNGEHFDAKAVKFTYDFLLDEKNNAGNRWILSTIKRVVLVADDPYQVIIETDKPDNMLLNRLNMFGAICPPQYIKEKGIAYFKQHPVGTGPFRFKRWDKGKTISLEKNQDYWQAGKPHYQQLSFKMVDKSRWMKMLLEGELDLVPNFPGNRTTELMLQSQGKLNLIKRLVLAGYWVLWHNEGILEDVDVRKALNHAVNKQDLVRYGDFGNSVALASLGKRHEFGANESLKPYRYNPEKAKTMLEQAGVKPGHSLSILASDIAEPVAKIIKANLQDVGFNIDLDVVSRSEWSKRVINYKLHTGKRSQYDLIINLVDNPIFHLGFHAGLFLDSRSPWSQINDPEFNRRFDASMTIGNPIQAAKAWQDLDRYIHQNAMMLFTTQRILTVVASKRTSINTFGLNGHLDYNLLSEARQLGND